MIWDELVKDGEAAVDRLMGRQETLTLEFKSDHPNYPLFIRGALTEHGRKLLAREMSAFSNSAGGVIVLGIDCRRVDGVDEATKLAPIEYLSRAESETRGSVSELLQPSHDGIEVLAISKPDQPEAGYIAISVPRSDRRPHRSEAKDQKNYYKRVGTSSVAMEHYDIEDAFHRVGAPHLLLRAAFRYRMKSGGERFDMLLQLAIENDGVASAKFITLQLWNRLGVEFTAPSGGPTRSEFGGRTLFAAASDYVVHPSQTRGFGELHFAVNRSPTGLLTNDHDFTLTEGSIAFDYSIGADGMKAVVGRFDLTTEQLTEIRRATEK